MSERRYDKTVADTFPASDPPANSGITGTEPSTRETDSSPDDSGTSPEPTGRPTSDRHATETAVVKEEDVKTR